MNFCFGDIVVKSSTDTVSQIPKWERNIYSLPYVNE